MRSPNLIANTHTDTTTPVGFDAQRHPVIAAHFFGVFGVDPIAIYAELDPAIVRRLEGDRFPPIIFAVAST